MLPKPKTTRLKGKGKTEFRKKVFNRSSGFCEDCGVYAPLLDNDGLFDVFMCGHVSHIKSYGAGGGDTLDNVKWKCYNCHINKEHGPKFSKLK